MKNWTQSKAFMKLHKQTAYKTLQYNFNRKYQNDLIYESYEPIMKVLQEYHWLLS